MSDLKKLFCEEEDYQNHKLVLTQKSRVSFIEMSRIVLIERQLRKSVIVTEDGCVHETYESLKQLEQILPTAHFFRTHKSFIVNKNRIEEVELYSNNMYIVKFSNIDDKAFITKDKLSQLLNVIEDNKAFA